MLHHWLLDSPAWHHLSLPARCLLIEVWRRHDGSNNGTIALSVHEAAQALRVGKNMPTALFRELIEKGFLKLRKRGAFTLKTKEASEYEITALDCNGRPASKDFMRWQPPAEIQNTLPVSGSDGPYFRDCEQ
jgi:hypothetical protein